MSSFEKSDQMKSEYDYLEHHGVKGQKWGIRRTPEQLGHKKSLLKGASESLKRRRKKAAAKKAKKAAKAKVDQAKKKEESAEEIREKVLKSVDPKLIYKHKNLLSDQELQERINRIQKEQQLKKMIADSTVTIEKLLKDADAMMKPVYSLYKGYDESIGKAVRRSMQDSQSSSNKKNKGTQPQKKNTSSNSSSSSKKRPNRYDQLRKSDMTLEEIWKELN